MKIYILNIVVLYIVIFLLLPSYIHIYRKIYINSYRLLDIYFLCIKCTVREILFYFLYFVLRNILCLYWESLKIEY